MAERRQTSLPPSLLLPWTRSKKWKERTKCKVDTIMEEANEVKLNLGKRKILSSYYLNPHAHPARKLLSSVYRWRNWGSANKGPRWGLIPVLSISIYLLVRSVNTQWGTEDTERNREESPAGPVGISRQAGNEHSAIIWMFVTPKFMCSNPNPHGDGIGRLLGWY